MLSAGPSYTKVISKCRELYKQASEESIAEFLTEFAMNELGVQDKPDVWASEFYADNWTQITDDGEPGRNPDDQYDSQKDIKKETA